MFGHKTKVNFIDKNQKSYMPAGEVKNPVTCGNIFIHPSARICRGIFDYLDNTLLGDSIIYNIWLLKGPLFYYDKAMSVYNYNLKGTWSRLDMRTKKLLNLTIPYRVLQYHKFKKYYKYCLNLLTLKKDKKIIKFLS